MTAPTSAVRDQAVFPYYRHYCAALLMSMTSGCGGSEAPAPAFVPRQSAEEAILQVSRVFVVTSEASRLLDPPSAIAIHRRRVETRIEVAPERMERQRTLDRLEYRDGRVLECTSESTRSLDVQFRFANGQPTAQLKAPDYPLSIACNGPVPAELPARLAPLDLTLVLRDERLVVLAPATDRRQFLPVD